MMIWRLDIREIVGVFRGQSQEGTLGFVSKLSEVTICLQCCVPPRYDSMGVGSVLMRDQQNRGRFLEDFPAPVT